MQLSTMMQINYKRIIKFVAISLLWLVIWQLIAVLVGKEILIPSPKNVLFSLLEISTTIDFWLAVLLSMVRITIGYISGVIIGFLGGVFSVYSSLFKSVFSPILHLIRAVPVASFIILALVWIKSPYLPIFISFLMVLPIVWSSVETGISQVDIRYIEMSKVYRLGSLKTLIQVKLPFIKPAFAASAVTALGLAWKSGIAAEVICRPELSLGRLLQDAKLYVETPRVFAVTAVVALLSLLLELIVKAFMKRFAND